MQVTENNTALRKIFNQQRDCYLQQPYPDYTMRISLLHNLRKLIKNNHEQIITAINQDFGCRPRFETETLEIFPSLESIDYALNNLSAWMKPRRHKTSKWFWPSKSLAMSIPRGVVGIISPWNYPLFLTIAPMVAAIAAGNRVMIKLSENVPKTSALIQKLFTQAFLETKIAVVLGDSEIAAEFSQLPFDHLLFTGATSIGKKVMQAASVNLTPITLELGGKSPVILTDKINYSDIDKIWLGKIINAGQTCIAPDYIWLPKDDGLERNLLEYSKLAVSKRFANLDQSEYCSIINKNQYDRILLLIDDAVTKGATWQPLIDFSGRWYSSDNNIYKIAPGLLLNAQHNMAIMQEEIFGPVLPVMKYDAIQELLTIMQALPRPLAIYLFTNNKTIQYDFIYKTLSGALSFNHTIVHAAQESLPFGGVNTSGMGHYRGRYGFDTFSLLKPIYKQSRLEIFSKFYPPKKMWQKFLLRFMLK